MSSYEGLKRLSEEQQKALTQTEEELTRWEKFKEDYEKVQKKLRELPDHLSYDYMVPFGPLAFMPGQLIHTNEILVLLGDNWFAEMSAKQACEVIDRRLKEIGKSIDALNEQKKLLQSRSEFTHREFSSQSQEIDITEEYDSDTERKWREAHRRRVREEKLTQRDGKCHTDSDVLQRLEDLQLAEMRGHEMSRLDEELRKTTNSHQESQTVTKKSVRWAGAGLEEVDTSVTRLNLPESSSASCSGSSSSEDSADLDSDDSDSGPHTSVIYFKHSPRSDSEEPQSTVTHDQGGGMVNSPSDIYKLYCKPKSILKSSGTFEEVKSTQPVQLEESRKERKPIKFHENQTAVQSHVIGKGLGAPSEMTQTRTHIAPQSGTHSYNNTLEQTITDNQNKPPQRVSKFKAMRQKKAS